MRPSDRIIRLLYDHPGRRWPRGALADAAGIDPADFDAAVGELRRRGHPPIDTHPDGAVALSGPPALDAGLIERDLPVQRVGRNVICFAELGSTNDTAADSARQTGADGLVVTAESQRAGRGRHGRRWISPPGANLLVSIVLCDSSRPTPVEALTVAAGLAVAEAIDNVLGRRCPRCELKWPNDVLIEGEKVAGVLVERRRGPVDAASIVGIGVNVNAHPPAGAVDRPATSLARHAGAPMDRIAVLRGVLLALDGWVNRLDGDEAEAVEALRERWTTRCTMLTQRHTIVDRGRRVTGRVIDIDPVAGLVVLTDDGTAVRIPAATATVE